MTIYLDESDHTPYLGPKSTQRQAKNMKQIEDFYSKFYRHNEESTCAQIVNQQYGFMWQFDNFRNSLQYLYANTTSEERQSTILSILHDGEKFGNFSTDLFLDSDMNVTIISIISDYGVDTYELVQELN
eukprot:TRINITY_DN1547_c0_g2_i6.p3 TRINITY_DN1547_c0_g2~~TRINITY_DN1547_c0_g2_i6.p3  ORF type:complete len:129 (+),score=9.21 TRINITY_DN1547_c0_g2_i6:209-595(+)